MILGTDTRISCDMLRSAFIAGACSVGATVLDVGIIPTPAVAYLTRHFKGDIGVVISASHNSFEFNGIKFFDKDGYKLSDEDEAKIECLVLESPNAIQLASAHNIGTCCEMKDAIWQYGNFLKSIVKSTDFAGLKIAMDCANGASYKIAPWLFKELGAQVYVINDTPNGTNINLNCGSTSINSLKSFVKDCGADIGFAFDGDADRVLAVDENAEILDGDRIIAIMSIHLKKKNRLRNDTVVVTVMSNLGFDLMAKEQGINVIKTGVGDRQVIAEMIKNDYILGGEQSGHIICLEHNTTGDGVLTALQLVNILKTSGQKTSELGTVMKVFPQILRNVKVKTQSKDIFTTDALIAKKTEELTKKLGDNGRVLVRCSGTEPLIRIMIEGENLDEISQSAAELARIVEERLN